MSCHGLGLNRRTRPLLVFLALLSGAAIACGQDAAPPSISKESIQGRIQATETSTSLDETQREAIIAAYRQLLSELDALEASRQQRDEFVKKREDVEEVAKATANSIEEIETPSVDAAGLTLDELDAKVRETKTQLDEAQQELDLWRNEPARRADRRVKIAELLASQNELVEQLATQAQEVSDDSTAELAEASKLAIQAQLRRAQMDIDQLGQELAFYDAAAELLPKQIEYRRKLVEALSQRRTLWENAAAARRNEEQQRQRQQTELVVQSLPEPLQKLAQKRGIPELPQQLESIGKAIRMIAQQRRKSEDLLSTLSEQSVAMRAQVSELTRVTGDVGMLLRQKRSDLPSPRKLRRENEFRHQDANEFRVLRLKNDQALFRLTDLSEAVRSETTELTRANPDVNWSEYEPQLQELLENEQRLRDQLRTDYNRYFRDLVELNVQQERLIRHVEQYRQFIDERVLWVPSADTVGTTDFRDAGAALLYVVKDPDWYRVVTSPLVRLRNDPWPQTVILVVALVMLVYRRRLKSRLTESGSMARSMSCTDFSLTPKAFVDTLALAALWPTVLLWISLNLRGGDTSGGSTLHFSLSRALLTAAGLYFGLSVWSQVVRNNGLAEAHFEWSSHALRLSRRHLFWLTPLAVTSWAVYEFFDRYDLFDSTDHTQQAISRLALLVGLAALAVFCSRMFSPRNGVFQRSTPKCTARWTWNWRFVWYCLVVGLPIAFAVLALVGYVYTAGYLVKRLGLSFFFLGGVVLLEAIGIRWVRLNRRRLAISQAQERLAAARSEASSDEEAGPPIIEEPLDLTAVNQQSARLFNSFSTVIAILGLYFIWVDVLPAMAKLDEIRLWQTSVEVQQTTATNEDAETTTVAMVREVQWITLGNLCAAALVLFLMLVAIRNIPGLLEIAILQHLPLDNALRYAITTVTRYAIIIGGLVIAFSCLGIGWSNVQWLIAAVSVGLGFGLQEIFANFVSGLILLFERPLRAGDIVTIGDVTGRVVRINTRATTIQDWDRKELVVPNKEFITGRLLNWTLTDTTNRLVISVGVAYGSDIRRARQILLDAAQDHPAILSDPAPSVTFDQFGDSALNLTLRAYLPSLDNRLTVTDEMNEEIYNRLAQAKIEIPFPQRDLHLRSSETIRLATDKNDSEQAGNGRSVESGRTSPQTD